MYHINLPQ